MKARSAYSSATAIVSTVSCLDPPPFVLFQYKHSSPTWILSQEWCLLLHCCLVSCPAVFEHASQILVADVTVVYVEASETTPRNAPPPFPPLSLTRLSCLPHSQHSAQGWHLSLGNSELDGTRSPRSIQVRSKAGATLLITRNRKHPLSLIVSKLVLGHISLQHLHQPWALLPLSAQSFRT